eukprot:4056635-Pleurochrysis_carterae.AAC.1
MAARIAALSAEAAEGRAGQERPVEEWVGLPLLSLLLLEGTLGLALCVVVCVVVLAAATSAAAAAMLVSVASAASAVLVPAVGVMLMLMMWSATAVAASLATGGAMLAYVDFVGDTTRRISPSQSAGRSAARGLAWPPSDASSEWSEVSEEHADWSRSSVSEDEEENSVIDEELRVWSLQRVGEVSCTKPAAPACSFLPLRSTRPRSACGET